MRLFSGTDLRSVGQDALVEELARRAYVVVPGPTFVALAVQVKELSEEQARFGLTLHERDRVIGELREQLAVSEGALKVVMDAGFHDNLQEWLSQ